MATITSVGTGAWSASGTWNSGVPADGDDVVIASGHTVTFDVDQSAFTTGVGITITGTLTHTTTTGTYCLFAKTGASIVGAGTWNIGTSGTPIPFAAKHTITGRAGWYVDGVAGLTMTVYGAEPSIKYVKLSGDEAIGQTELSVDTDVRGDIWAAGDIIRITNIAGSRNSEERVIAAGGIAETTITVTAGLTSAKLTGSIVSLITRNVKIIAVGTGARTIYRVGETANKLTIGGGMFYGCGKNMIDACRYAAISGGSFSGNTYAVAASNYVTISRGVFSGDYSALKDCSLGIVSGGVFGGCHDVFSTCHGTFIANALIYGSVTGISTFNPLICYNCTFLGIGKAIYNCTSPIIDSSVFSLCGSGIDTSYFISCADNTFTINTSDLVTVSGILYNCTLGSSAEHNTYASMGNMLNCQSEDHDGVDGALKAWCKGGVVTSQTGVKPDGYMQAYLLDPESATYPVFFTKQFSVEPSKTVNVVVQLRKDASMTYLPRVYLMASIGNPLAGATPVDTFTMTDSIDTWETDTFTITNSTDYDQDYTLWFVAKNASGNAYSAYEITTAGGTGGGLLTNPGMTGGMRG